MMKKKKTIMNLIHQNQYLSVLLFICYVVPYFHKQINISSEVADLIYGIGTSFFIGFILAKNQNQKLNKVIGIFFMTLSVMLLINNVLKYTGHEYTITKILIYVSICITTLYVLLILKRQN